MHESQCSLHTTDGRELSLGTLFFHCELVRVDRIAFVERKGMTKFRLRHRPKSIEIDHQEEAKS